MTNTTAVGAQVPKYQIDWIVGRYHVGTPSRAIRAEIRRRCVLAGADKAVTAACCRYAARVHERNLRLYSCVTGGR